MSKEQRIEKKVKKLLKQTTFLKAYKLTPKSLLSLLLFALLAGAVLILLSRAESNILGDVNGDSVVNTVDLSIVLTNFTKNTDYAHGDLDSSGLVDITDLSIVLSHYGKVDVKPPGTLPAPQGLRTGVGNGYVDLTWDAVPNAPGYVVETMNGSGQWQQIDSTFGSLRGTTYRINNLVNGQSYNLRVAAFNGSGVGAYSQISAKPTGPVVPYNAAKAAVAYRDTIGANSHVNYGSAFYPNYDKVRAKLKEAGIRNLRAGLPPGIAAYDNWSPNPWNQMKLLMSDGVEFLWGAGSPNTPITDADLTRLKTVKDGVAGSDGVKRGGISGFEGQNEWNNDDYATSGQGPYTGDQMRTYLKSIHDRIRADSAWNNTHIVAPTEAGGQRMLQSEALRQLGNISAWVDRGNIHPYSADSPGTNLAYLRSQEAGKTGTEPIWITEYGWAGKPSSDSFYMSERSAGIYAPRHYLEAFVQGFEHSYWFSLIDDFNDSTKAVWNFGLLRNDATPKPSFNAIKNLNDVIGDGRPTTLAGTRYKIDTSATDLRSLLLQSSDGSYSLVLWRNVRVWDYTAKKDLSPGAVPVTVTFGQSFNVAEYRPNTGAGPVNLFDGPVSTKVNVAGEVVVLKLKL